MCFDTINPKTKSNDKTFQFNTFILCSFIHIKLDYIKLNDKKI